MDRPLVTVVVPTRNRPTETVACVRSVRSQAYPNIEIIVVDGNSTDNTCEAVAPIADRVITFPEPGDHRSAQRNLGVKKAKGDYVLIIDSDMTLSPNVVARCVEKMQDEKIKGIIIPEESFGVGFWAQCKKLEKSFYIGVDAIEAARFFRKADFEAVGGYNEALASGEDWDISDRIEMRGPLARIDDLIYHNEGCTSLLQSLKKKYYYAQKARTYLLLTKNVPTAHKRIVGVFARYDILLRHPIELFRRPLIGLGLLWMKICEFGVGGIGYVLNPTIVNLVQAKPTHSFTSNVSHQPKTSSISNKPIVSVIIACKNTAQHFEQCLQSVRAQTYKNIEIIVVDNFSKDGTFEIARKYADQTYQMGPERSTQFNFGFLKSRGELIYRIGPDYVLEPDLIQKCVEKIAGGYDALALHNRSVGDSIWAKVRYLERESYRNDNSIVAVRFMRREVFENIGMFDETLVAGEDFDLHNRMVLAGYRWVHVDAIENHVGEPRNIVEVWNKFYYYGRTIRRYRQKNEKTAKEQLVFFRPSYRKIHKVLLHSPRLFISFYVYMFIKYFAGFCGMVRGAPRSLPS